MIATAIEVTVKGFVSLLAVLAAGAFLYALWVRELDLRQYGTTKYWIGRWFESWFPENPNLVKNGSFEQGAYGWGTGWIESLPGAREFARRYRYVNLMGADARWTFSPEGGRANSAALFVEHRSARQDLVFSTISQQIELKPYTQYEVRFWAKVDSIDTSGGMTVFCGVSDVTEWEMGHASVDERPHDWKTYRFRFTTDDRVFVDVRVRTESPMRGWVDDITVREVIGASVGLR
jgi:hypothetical protein